jgi:hypothetical protein
MPEIADITTQNVIDWIGAFARGAKQQADTVAVRDTQIAQINQQLADRIAVVQQRDTQIASLGRQLATSVALVATRDAEIVALKAQIVALQQTPVAAPVVTPPPPTTPAPTVVLSEINSFTANQVIDYQNATLDLRQLPRIGNKAPTLFDLRDTTGTITIKNFKYIATPDTVLFRVNGGVKLVVENIRPANTLTKETAELTLDDCQCGDFVKINGLDTNVVVRNCHAALVNRYFVYAQQNEQDSTPDIVRSPVRVNLIVEDCTVSHGSWNETVLRAMIGTYLLCRRCSLMDIADNPSFEKGTVVRIHGEGLIEDLIAVGWLWAGPRSDQDANAADNIARCKIVRMTMPDGGIRVNYGLGEFVLEDSTIIAQRNFPEWGYAIAMSPTNPLNRAAVPIKLRRTAINTHRNKLDVKPTVQVGVTLNTVALATIGV